MDTVCLGAREAQNIETSIKDTNEDRAEAPKEQERKLKLAISRSKKLQSADG